MWRCARKDCDIRDGKGGIDAWRYQQVIIIPKLIPFAQECNRKQKEKGLEEMIVQEDSAPAHSSKLQTPVWMASGILRLLWPGNSPDLNMIEPCWFYQKKKTTEKGPPKAGKDARSRWIEAWKALPQEKIQAWIERIPRHIKEVIRLKGGNNYKEGRTGLDELSKEGKRALVELHAEFARAKPVSRNFLDGLSNPEEEWEDSDVHEEDIEEDIQVEDNSSESKEELRMIEEPEQVEIRRRTVGIQPIEPIEPIEIEEITPIQPNTTPERTAIESELQIEPT